MKGVVFTEFIDMVEGEFGLEMADALLSNDQLESGGVYTAIGTYSHAEIVMLVVDLSKRTQIAVPDLLRHFGKYLFGRFAVLYPQFVHDGVDMFSFLESIENYIHREVKNLYPDAQLPSFSTKRNPDGSLSMHYSSVRKMADLAVGLIDGCSEHFGVNAELKTELIQEDGSECMFHISVF